jgi:hypothetical protein
MGPQLAEPDAVDEAQGTTVFLCRDKASGRAIGTMRIQTSHPGPLMMEQSVTLPGWLAAAPRAEITRLAVSVGADPLTKLCLMKASYLFCMAAGAMDGHRCAQRGTDAQLPAPGLHRRMGCDEQVPLATPAV